MLCMEEGALELKAGTWFLGLFPLLASFLAYFLFYKNNKKVAFPLNLEVICKDIRGNVGKKG